MEELKTVWVNDTTWQKLPKPKRCRRIDGATHSHCPNMAEWAFPRSNGLWAYCPEHMYGRKIVNGKVMVEVYEDSIAAKQGYL